MIKITVGKSQKVTSKESMFIAFDFDMNLVNLIREYSSRFYHGNTKTWELPVKYFEDFISKVQDNHEIELTVNVEKEKTDESIPKDFTFKTKPFEHQIEGFVHGLNNDKFLLGDEQGLGKTKQIIDIAVAKKLSKGYKHCLIICGVNGLKWNWQNEIKTHSNENGYILGTKYRKNGTAYIGSLTDRLNDLENLPEDYFIITNVETLRDNNITNKIKELAKNNIINMIAVDEIHKCKNPTSQQGRNLLKLSSESMIGMSGTPLMNNPLDLYIILKWLGFMNQNFTQFKRHFCLFGNFNEITGYKNLNELKEYLDENMLRRLKSEVLDLPEKIHTIEYVEMNKEQTKIYNDVLKAIKEDIDKIKLSPMPLAQLIRLRQATGYTGILSSTINESAKMDRLEEIVEELSNNGSKAIIFSNWTDITNPIYNRLKAYNPAIITGETKDRKEQELKFKNDPTCKVIIGTIGAMGTGLTLTSANTVIFMDSPWNRANKEQAEDRAHRIGTTGTVNIITLVTKGTIDERIEEIINEKGALADSLVDGKITKNKEQMLDFLLS